MPCGGIYSLEMHFAKMGAHDPNAECRMCDERGIDVKQDLFVDEWDAFLHRKCLGMFLASDEGRIVLTHGHEISTELEGNL